VIPVRRGDQLEAYVYSDATSTFWIRVAGIFETPTGRRWMKKERNVEATADFSITNFPRARFDHDGMIYTATAHQVGGTTPEGPGHAYIDAFIGREGESAYANLLGDWYYNRHWPRYPGERQGWLDGPGAIWSYADSIVNDGITSGDHVRVVTLTRGSRLEILHGFLYNGDAAGRAAYVRIQDNNAGTESPLNQLTGTRVANVTIAAANLRSFPAAAPYADSVPNQVAQRYFLGNRMELEANLIAIAISQDSELALTGRVWGPKPTVTVTSPAGSTLTTLVDRLQD